MVDIKTMYSGGSHQRHDTISAKSRLSMPFCAFLWVGFCCFPQVWFFSISPLSAAACRELHSSPSRTKRLGTGDNESWWQSLSTLRKAHTFSSHRMICFAAPVGKTRHAKVESCWQAFAKLGGWFLFVFFCAFWLDRHYRRSVFFSFWEGVQGTFARWVEESLARMF